MARIVPIAAASLLVPGLVACAASEPVDGTMDAPPEAPGTWSTAAPVPDARTEVSVATDGERIWLIGGFAPPPGGGSAIAPRAMHIYDSGSDSWTTPDSIPDGVNHAGFAYVDGRLYIVGGFHGATFEPTDAVHIRDLASGTWSRGAPMPTARGAIALAVLDGRIHAIGGNAANAGSLGDGHNVGSDGSSVGTHEVYDPATDTWTRLAPLPTPRNHLGAATVRRRIHVVGGRVGGDFTLTAHEIWDPATNAWTAAPPLPTGRSGIAVISLDERLYVFGGETMGGARQGTFDEAERFDAASDVWQALPPMPTARHGLGAAVIGEAIHVLSGGPEPGFAFSTAHEVLRPGS